MSENKILKEYLSDIGNEEANYNCICSKIESKHRIKKITNIFATIFVIVIMGVITPKIYAGIAWNIEYKEYQNRKINIFTTAIDNAIEDGYVENLNMHYSYQDGIGVKIDSLMITKDSVIMNVNIKLNDYKNINSDTLDFGYALYDENNNIYAICDRYDHGTEKAEIYERKLYTELGIKYNKNDIYSINQADSKVKEKMQSKDGEIITQVRIKSFKGFEKSKKIYIRIFDIGFTMVDETTDNSGKVYINNAQDFKLSNCEWQFEIGVPEKFYKNNIIELQLAEKIDKVELAVAELSETGMILRIDMKENVKDTVARENIYITDGKGHIYTYGAFIIDNDKLQLSFDIAKKDLTKKLYLNMDLEGSTKTIELLTPKI